MSEVVVARELDKVIGGRFILRGISASVAAGSVIGLLGKNGAGKTTLLDVLLGFSPATSGSVQLWGEDSVRLSAASKARIGYVPQQDELVPMMTGAQQLALTAALHREWDSALIERLIKEWEVPLDRRIAVLSGGERQKISMLLALGNRPELLVLDEPLASLDPVARRSFLRQLLEITADQTRTVIFSSHIVSDLERVANQVWIMREGAMRWIGEMDLLKESVVRLHITAPRGLVFPLNIPNVISVSHPSGDTVNRATVCVAFVEEMDPVSLGARLGAGVQVEIETLDLEDIFVELHR